MEEIKIMSPVTVLEEFKKGTIRKDIDNELDAWERDIQAIQDGSDSQIELYRCQGRKEAIKHFRDLPQILIDLKEAQSGE